MPPILRNIRHSLLSKLVVTLAVTLVLGVSLFSYFVIDDHKNRVMQDLGREADRLGNTIRLGTHYAMTLNSREDIQNIIMNIGRQREIENIRIYNKAGQITFTNLSGEAGKVTNIKDEACFVCHRTEPAQVSLDLSERTRIFRSAAGYRQLGIMSPIYNEPSCATDECHVHPSDKKVLGLLDLVISLDQADREMGHYVRRTVGLALLVTLLTTAAAALFILLFVKRPMSALMSATKAVAKGDYSHRVGVTQDDEMGRLAEAFNQMSREIGAQQAELNRQRDEYQQLFEEAPCLITVQDRDFRLLKYNREFAEKFQPEPGDCCYRAYKGREKKCNPCPVETTFAMGSPTYSEESALNKEGQLQAWLVHTSPIRDTDGQVVAAMEMSIDITQRRRLEQELAKSELKYHAIFNNIPNPVFVLDENTLDILDVNDSMEAVYGWTRDEIVGRSVLTLFQNPEETDYASELHGRASLDRIRHQRMDGRTIFVNMRVSPSEYGGRRVLLLTSSDITKRLEVEQQLNQASKLATLGEMATGVAHELNQPLSVIKTVSSFVVKKINKGEPIDDATLRTLLEKVDGNVDRATRIITHMRLFARKTDVRLVPMKLFEVIERAFEIFNQQLRVRGIEVFWDIAPDLPGIMADPHRLEQVFINLLLNARDAIEERWAAVDPAEAVKRITLTARSDGHKVQVWVRDTGKGIPPENLDKVFDPFFTTKEAGEGTGLGLSISYGIVKDCGGEIRALAGPGEGAVFLIEFPILRDEP
jgi:histidine kinase